MTRPRPVWLFDLDNTLHDASFAAFGPTNEAMNDYIVRHVRLTLDEASAQGQPQAGALHLLVRSPDLAELLKHRLLILGGDADPSVGH